MQQIQKNNYRIFCSNLDWSRKFLLVPIEEVSTINLSEMDLIDNDIWFGSYVNYWVMDARIDATEIFLFKKWRMLVRSTA